MSIQKIFLVIAITATSVFATIYKVDKNSANNPDFTDLQAAHDGVSDGDTLYVVGSSQNYNGLLLTKKLFIFGPGYFLSQNPETQVKPLAAKLSSNLEFNSGSEGSLVTGLTIYSEVHIRTNDISLKRNYIKAYLAQFSWMVKIGSNISNIIFAQNYMVCSLGRNVNISDNCHNIIFTNNFLAIDDLSSGAVFWMANTSSAQLENNIFYGDILLENSTFYNNIQRIGSFTGSNNFVQYNIGNSTQFGTSGGNQSNVDMNTVFVGSGSTDGQWQLKEGSPAIGAGQDGVDCGMFGGDDAYILSGLPAIPAIYFFDAPISGSGSQGLPVHVKIKSHN